MIFRLFCSWRVSASTTFSSAASSSSRSSPTVSPTATPASTPSSMHSSHPTSGPPSGPSRPEAWTLRSSAAPGTPERPLAAFRPTTTRRAAVGRVAVEPTPNPPTSSGRTQTATSLSSAPWQRHQSWQKKLNSARSGDIAMRIRINKQR